MTLILAIIPVLLLIVLMAFFKMSGDKSSIISLIVTMLIALFGFAFSDHSIKKGAKSICHRFCLRTDPRSGLLSGSCAAS